ncbi:type I restriction endonuclease [Methylococcus mesophilus]|uniref:type I restriction endonuclease n=1 Tax=Methylococcus mesophilus TaxID=2993564 RepID=UPI00224B041D|nr:type I restriction endonuclease [Methylococcus mesophilus]UZR27470.1 type I restriction endonuclease [Methylococcus mesophilus]
MSEFRSRMLQHVEHVKNVGPHCDTEETTKQALILPVLDVLGFSPYDPTKVKAEFAADFPGVKANERVDYALFCNGVPVMFIEAKSYTENLSNHAPQLSRYFNATPEVTIAAITNGREWRYFTDLVDKNVMDKEPFLTVDFSSLRDADMEQLGRFRHDRFQPEALRTLAEESVFLAAFKAVVKRSVLEGDADFVRYVAGKSTIQRTLTAKFLEQITPIVKQAVAQTMSDMVVNSLSAPSLPEPSATPQSTDSFDDDIIDPSNSKIVTTAAERALLGIVLDLLAGEPLSGKDTESYFSVLYSNKVNRWLLRYTGNKRRPVVQFIVPLTPQHRSEIERAGLEIGSGNQILLDKPEYLMRISGLLFDALAYCKDDDNFKLKKEK